MKKAVMVISAAILIAAFTGLAGSALAGEPCPWTITEVGVAKHSNGEKLAETFVKGSFPTSATDERPDWYINGMPVGKSMLYADGRWIPGSSSSFKLGANTVMVKFNKPPYRGASFQCTISLFNWLAVHNGGMNWYSCE